MAYCSYCAAALDPAQAMCTRCGRAVAAEPAPVPVPVVNKMPSSVQLGTGLLVASLVISLFSLAGLLMMAGMGRLPVAFFLRTLGLWILEIVLIVCIWQRQAWARIAIALLLAWSICNLMLTVLRVGGSIGLISNLVVPFLVDAARLCAVYLLFRPTSNAWFKK